ncbi:hypothetical protein PILCRDRAFT_137798 [Piloderma croceum F 1598]|uniref:Uncharacterized protein n=1 Tax=Piloderma croceum (strain F 1598) TaxID=765440 RepID=A0A0C3CPV9_PILCF|nr:hypothetical protein PILCRDRAFT_137798 [Piloderma croceum F 1598]
MGRMEYRSCNEGLREIGKGVTRLYEEATPSCTTATLRSTTAGRTSFALGGPYRARSASDLSKDSRKSYLNQLFCPDTRCEVELLQTTIQYPSQQVGSCLEIYQNRRPNGFKILIRVCVAFLHGSV